MLDAGVSTSSSEAMFSHKIYNFVINDAENKYYIFFKMASRDGSRDNVLESDVSTSSSEAMFMGDES